MTGSDHANGSQVILYERGTSKQSRVKYVQAMLYQQTKSVSLSEHTQKSGETEHEPEEKRLKKVKYISSENSG
jgi:hypothetical protein